MHGPESLTFTVQPSKLIEALDFVSIVKPRSLTAQEDSGAYLFRCARERNGRPLGYVYSRSHQHVARAGFNLEDLSGEGLLTMPARHVSILKSKSVTEGFVTVTFRTLQKADGDSFCTSVSSDGRVIYNYCHAIDPRLISPCDKDFAAACANRGTTYNARVLRAGIHKARAFLPPEGAKDVAEYYKTLQIFDASRSEWAKGNGVLFCSDASRAFYFEHETLRDKGLAIHLAHVPILQDFLRRCEGLTIYRGQRLSFAKNESTHHEKDQILGWVHDAATHPRFAHYGLSRDKYVIIAPRAKLLEALNQARPLVARNRDRVKLCYTHKHPQTGGHTIHFEVHDSAGRAESVFVTTEDKRGPDGTTIELSLEEDFECHVPFANFRSVIEDAADDFVELRIAPIPKDESCPRGGAMLRTIEEIEIAGDEAVNGTRCKVTRFTPSVL